MKTLFMILGIILLSAILVPRIALGNVLISQVYYDPINTQSGGEAIELYNPTNNEIEISNYILKTRSSTTTIPDDTWINSQSYYLVGDRDFHLHKDNEHWVEADYENTMSLANTNAGVALMFNDTVIDAVGWGNPNNIDDYLYQGEPASHVPKGYSLLRINNTQNNSNDFIKFETWFRNSLVVNDIIDIDIEFVSNEAITNNIINNITILNDDSLKKGIQIKPNPGTEKEIKVLVNIENVNLSNIKAIFNEEEYSMIKEDNSTFYSVINIPYYLSAGKYNITIIAEADQLIETKKIEFEFLPIISISSTTDLIQCDKKNCTITDNAPIIKNNGNIPLSILLESNDENLVKYAIEDEWLNLENRNKVFELYPSEEIKIKFQIQPNEETVSIKVRAGMK